MNQTTSPSRAVAEAVRMHLARKRISQQTAATAAHLSQASLSRRLCGALPFTVDEVYSLAAVLDVPPTALLPRPTSAVA